MGKHAFAVSGIHCENCADLIDQAVSRLPGVLATHTSHTAARTEVDLSAATTPAEVATTITHHGYPAIPL
ncbi:heavy-metal-associated domain-containing protein [Catellatospora tritici]|uniref:heavy-metal-associated domain-containing protein n=1 Tax=Catellatospora tritici TaxID=2851566 RepID=UPI001C2D47DE|nr:heavy metal-associated domain-containing protein [Catellatospora tritici]MBV1855510.1 heavy-metal-associated domain-containing protein [Catellatospora tritici]